MAAGQAGADTGFGGAAAVAGGGGGVGYGASGGCSGVAASSPERQFEFGLEIGHNIRLAIHMLARHQCALR